MHAVSVIFDLRGSSSKAAKWPLTLTFYMVLTVLLLLVYLYGTFWIGYVLPPRQIKSTVRLCQRIKNRRRQIQTFDLNNN